MGKSWDDIASGLSMDTSPRVGITSSGKPERNERIPAGELLQMLIGQEENAPVRIVSATNNVPWMGKLLDLSQGGLKVTVSRQCKVGERVKITFLLGKRRVVMTGEIRWRGADESGGGVVAGIQFVNPNPEDVEFISSLVTAKYFLKSSS